MAILTGTNGNDTLAGTSEDDTFRPLAGLDTASGAAGFDLLSVDYSALAINGGVTTLADSADGSFHGTVTAGAGIATITFSGMESLSFVLSAGSDRVELDGTPLLSGGMVNLDGGGGLDTLKADFSAFDGIQFSQGANFLITSSRGAFAGFEQFDLALGTGINTVQLQGGNDIVRSIGGTDRIDLGGGHDLWLADYSGWTSAVSFGWDGDRRIAAVSNGTEVSGLEGGMITGGSADDAFFLSGSGAFDVDGATGRDMLVWDETGRFGASYPAYFENAGDGSFFGSIAGSSFTGIEQVNVALSEGDNYAFVDTAPLSLGATMNLDGGGGTDRLDVDFSAYADTTFAIDASGTAITSHGIYGHFEHFGMALGSGANTVSASSGDDTIYSLGGIDQIDGGGGFDAWGGDYSASTGALAFAWNGTAGSATLSNGTALAGMETGYLVTGAGDDIFTLSGLRPFDVFGGEGTDRLVRDDTGFGGGNPDSWLYGAGGSFFGWIGNGQFDGIEQISAILGDDDSSAVVDAAPLAAGAQLTLDGGVGNDILLADFSAIAGITFTVAANGAITSSHGAFRRFESFSIGLGGGANSVTLGAGADRVQAAHGGTNVISTGAGDDEIWGGIGAETADGGAGNDVFHAAGLAAGYALARDGFGGYVLTDSNLADGDNGTDRLAGMEWVQFADQRVALPVYGAGVNLTGTAGADVLIGTANDDRLTGLAGNDTLDGGGGADVLTGGAGNDTYSVDSAADIVNETLSEGADTVRSTISWTLGTHIENLVLLGSDSIDATGNDGANSLTGNSGSNRLSGLAGNDSIDGGAGADAMSGGLGNDTFFVDQAGDTVIELAAQGLDTVRASVSWQLGLNVENLTLAGTAAIDAAGNDLANSLVGNAAANRLTGLAGNDTLDGGLGADTLVGGLGNDTYVVDNPADIVTELTGEGTDLVRSSVSWSLGTTTENLTLGGMLAINGTGNAAANVLTGNSGANELFGLDGNDTLSGGTGNDLLVGGAGADTLTGGSGADRFRFDILEPSANRDTIKDFARGTDKLEISRPAFSALAEDPAGALDPSAYHAGTVATLASHHLIYNVGTGALYYDADGAGGTAQVQIALLSTRPALSPADFVLV